MFNPASLAFALRSETRSFNSLLFKPSVSISIFNSIARAIACAINVLFFAMGYPLKLCRAAIKRPLYWRLMVTVQRLNNQIRRFERVQVMGDFLARQIFVCRLVLGKRLV